MTKDRFEVREANGCKIVKDRVTEIYYLTLEAYAKQAEKPLKDVEQKAKDAVYNQDKSDDPSIYQILDLGILGAIGVPGRYLIPSKMVFIWLLEDSRQKALITGCEAVGEAIELMFDAATIEAENEIKEGDVVRLKQGEAKVPALGFDVIPCHFEREDLGRVLELEYPVERLSFDSPDSKAAIIGFKRWGYRGFFKVRIELDKLEKMENNPGLPW